MNTSRRPRFLPLLSLALLLAPGVASAVEPAAEDAAAAPQAFALRGLQKADGPGKPARALPSERMAVDLAGTPELMLPGIDVEQLVKEDDLDARLGNKALRIGVRRDLPALAGGAAARGLDGNWYDLDGGARLWSLEVGSAGALGLRLHLAGVRLPAGAELAIYSPSDLPPLSQRKADPTAGTGRVEVYQAGSPADLWTATFAGERLRLEYYAPASGNGEAAARELPFTLDRLQHVYRDPVAGVVAGKGKVAGPCHNDVSCFPEWADTARAVAGIGFIDQNFLYCTGQLLNSQKPDFTPYWLTANHCVSTQESANSSEIFWLYQTGSCGGPAPALTASPRSVGTSLVATSPTSDFALLMVEGTVPRDLTWAGWNAAKINDGTAAVAIHHPAGDFKRISFGDKGNSDACGSPNLVRINWTDAPTEPGSSGSGIFMSSTQQLFGQLFFGPSACGNETYDCYGYFNSTFTKIKNQLKNGGSDDKLEQNDTCAKARTVKAGTQRGAIVKIGDGDWYKINVPKGKTIEVTVNFNHPSGDIDAALYANCKTAAFATSNGTGNSETFNAFNASNKTVPVYWNVFLADDVRASYDMTVSLR